MRFSQYFLLVVFLSSFSVYHPSLILASEGGGHETSKETKADSAEGGGKKGGKDKDNTVTGGRFEGDPVYVHLPQTLLPIIDDDGYQQVLHMLIDVGVKDLKTAEKVKNEFPRVQDAILSNLYSGFSDGTLRIGKSIDIEKTKKSVGDSIKKLFGSDSVQEVLIQGLAQRPY